MRKPLLGVLALVAVGCGDNSEACGPGTIDTDGECLPATTCGNGTVLDVLTNTCMPDPSVCQDGTMLIGDQCVVPTSTPIDDEEGPEPNGLGVIEPSANPAGLVALKPIGNAFVVHGTIVPFEDADGDGQVDPDVDSYLVTITAPTLLSISAVGLHGLDAGFVSFAQTTAAGDPIGSWERFGINLGGDTSTRQLFVPEAGTYVLAITASRTLLPIVTGGTGFPVVSGDDGQPAEYYVAITQLAIPAPIQLASSGGVAATAGSTSAVQFFTTALGSGFNDIAVTAEPDTITPSVIAMNDSVLEAVANGSPATATFGGISPTSTPVVVVDVEVSTAYDPGQFTLTLTSNDAIALPTAGGSVTITDSSTSPVEISDFTPLYFDVGAVDEIDGLALTFDRGIDFAIVDGRFSVVSAFTWQDGSPVGDTARSYHGLLRFAAPGRYYVVAYDPAGTAGVSTYRVSSQLAPVAALTITTAVPLDDATNVFTSNPYTYDASGAPWQSFDATGTNTLALTATFFDPRTAYGRLDPITVDEAASGGATNALAAADPLPIFAYTFAETGGPRGRIVLDDSTTNYLVKVNTRAGVEGRALELNFAPQTYDDLGTIDTMSTQTLATETLAAGGKNRYLVHSTDGDRVIITATPTAADVELVNLNVDETAQVTLNKGGAGAAETGTFAARHTGWTAFEVTGANATTSGGYALTVMPTVAGSYFSAAGATPFVDACTGTGSAVIAMHADAGPFGSPDDEGLSNPINVPAGFAYYGDNAGAFVISTNGFLTFDTSIQLAQFTNTALPTASPVAIVAPFWTDLANVQVCTKTGGGKIVVQWRGTQFGSGAVVATQAILTAATGTIELVWDASQTDTGGDATIGVEDYAGATATQVGFDEPAQITPGSSQLLTPQ